MRKLEDLIAQLFKLPRRTMRIIWESWYDFEETSLGKLDRSSSFRMNWARAEGAGGDV